MWTVTRKKLISVDIWNICWNCRKTLETLDCRDEIFNSKINKIFDLKKPFSVLETFKSFAKCNFDFTKDVYKYHWRVDERKGIDHFYRELFYSVRPGCNNVVEDLPGHRVGLVQQLADVYSVTVTLKSILIEVAIIQCRNTETKQTRGKIKAPSGVTDFSELSAIFFVNVNISEKH